MRLKTFSAATMNEALALVKKHFGDEAIIVSTQAGENGEGVRVTAAIDSVEQDYEAETYADTLDDPLEVINEALAHNGIPPAIADSLLTAASELELDNPVIALAGALDHHFEFSPLPAGAGRPPILLVGLPGAGKTVTTAKLATQAVMRKEPVHVVTTDTVRAGGFAQLEAFTRILKIDLASAGTPEELKRIVAACSDGGQILIDCAGGNPFDEDDFDRQLRLIRSVKAEVVLVMAAGGDPLEAADIAEIYRQLGARRLLVTRIDAARRFGAVLSAASAGRLAITDVGIGPSVPEGLRPMNPVTLARLLLPESVVLKYERPQSSQRGAYG